MKREDDPISGHEDFSARDLLIILFKFKYRILASFILVSLALTLPLWQRPLYEAKSLLLIKIGREFRTNVNGSRQLMISQEGINNSEIKILTSQDSIAKVINTIKLQNLYPDLLQAEGDADKLEAAVLRFSKALTVQEVRNSNVIEISFRHEDRRVAARAVNLLVETFKERHLEAFSDGDSSFVRSQLAQYQSKLRESEERLQQFKERNGVVAQEEQVKVLLARCAEIDDEKIEAENSIRELSDRLPVLKARGQKFLAMAKTNKDPSGRRTQEEAELKLVNMQIEEQQLLKKYPPSSQMVQALRNEMGVIRAFLKENELRYKKAESDPAYQKAESELVNAEMELKAQKGRLATLQRERESVAQQIQLLEKSDKAIQTMKRERDIDARNYEAFVGRAEESRLSSDMDRLKLANVSVIQRATPPTEPVEPKVVKVLLRGIALGLASGLAIAVASEFLNQGLYTPQALERRLGITVMLSINKQ